MLHLLILFAFLAWTYSVHFMKITDFLRPYIHFTYISIETCQILNIINWFYCRYFCSTFSLLSRFRGSTWISCNFYILTNLSNRNSCGRITICPIFHFLDLYDFLNFSRFQITILSNFHFSGILKTILPKNDAAKIKLSQSEFMMIIYWNYKFWLAKLNFPTIIFRSDVINVVFLYIFL